MMRTQDQIACGLKIAGMPEERVEDAPRPQTVAAMPEQIPLLKARLLAKTGDRVKIGTPLYGDKQNTDIVFPSPGCGEIIDIRYGPRRVISEIVIRLDENEETENHRIGAPADPAGLERSRLVEILLAAGMWPFIRDVVFRGVADPGRSPAALWVALDNRDPFHPPAGIYLGTPDDRRFFQTGLRALQVLCERVFVCRSKDTPLLDKAVENLVTHRVSGGYPAEDPGVLHYRFKTDPSQNTAWFITGQDTLLLGEFFETGRFPVSRTVAVSGAETNGRYARTRIGASLETIAGPIAYPQKYRWIEGGLFRGYSVTPDAHLGLYETGLSLIEESGRRELFGFMRPGWKKPTCSRTFLSVLNPGPLPVDADMHGAERACVNCGACTRACPVDILPQFTYKCILAEEVEEALSHGLLDCVECGMCSYVCPSKVELCKTFRETKQAYFKGRI